MVSKTRRKPTKRSKKSTMLLFSRFLAPLWLSGVLMPSPSCRNFRTDTFKLYWECTSLPLRFWWYVFFFLSGTPRPRSWTGVVRARGMQARLKRSSGFRRWCLFRWLWWPKSMDDSSLPQSRHSPIQRHWHDSSFAFLRNEVCRSITWLFF